MKNIMKLFGIIALVVVIGFSMVACQGNADPNSLDGVWSGTNFVITIRGNTGTVTQTKNLPALWQSAFNENWIRNGGTFWRNLSRTGDPLIWTGQAAVVLSYTGAGTNATGIEFRTCTIYMNPNGRTFRITHTMWGGTTNDTIYTRN